jgi:hypothetical protein
MTLVLLKMGLSLLMTHIYKLDDNLISNYERRLHTNYV